MWTPSSKVGTVAVPVRMSCASSAYGLATLPTSVSNGASTGSKQWRGIATRYDEYALTYLGGVLLACAVIHARAGTRDLGDTAYRYSDS